MLQMFENIDEKYISEASPQNYTKQMHPIKWIAAACLCLILSGIGVHMFMNTQKQEDVYADPISDILGFDDCYIKAEEQFKDFYNWKYYTKINGEEKCIAEVYGYEEPTPYVNIKDIDGDGVAELICSCMAGTGKSKLYVYRNNNGVIERGHLVYEDLLRDEEIFPQYEGYQAFVDRENYNPQNDTFEIEYRGQSGLMYATLQGWNLLEFEPFVEGEW